MISTKKKLAAYLAEGGGMFLTQGVGGSACRVWSTREGVTVALDLAEEAVDVGAVVACKDGLFADMRAQSYVAGAPDEIAKLWKPKGRKKAAPAPEVSPEEVLAEVLA